MTTTRNTATLETIVDNERVRVTRLTWTPGAETGWHTHAHDYVIVPYADCRVRVETAAGALEAAMHRETPYFRDKGVSHNVISIEDQPFSLIEIEIKSEEHPC